MKVHGKYRYGLSAYEQAIRLCLYILGFWQRQQGGNELTREVLQFHTWGLPITREEFANFT